METETWEEKLEAEFFADEGVRLPVSCSGLCMSPFKSYFSS